MIMKKVLRTAFALAIGLALIASNVQAGEIGHYNPGVLNIRDFVLPEPGFYTAIYNYYYTTDRLNDRDGDEIDSITIRRGDGPGVTLGLDVDVDVYALAPTFLWVSEWKILGAKYGAYISPSFANSSVGAALSTQSGTGRDAETSSFDLGDLCVQPLWLGWSLKQWDLALGYAFYAPVGRYNTEEVTLSEIGTITAEAADNIGLGFWTHQFQGAASWYPWADKRMAVATALTYEIHGEKEDFDLTPGQNLTLNYGISQYLPVSKDQKLLLEVGPTGYSSWQITDDSGDDARNSDVHDEVHAAGMQLGLTYIPWHAVLNAHYFYEYAAEDRFQGQVLGLSLAMKF